MRFLKNLPNTNIFSKRFSRYTAYAIGEVILVVIGILIAVRIDNWNEAQKNNADFYDILKTVGRDLKEDIWQYDYLISDLERKDSILIGVISGQLKEGDYRRNWKELRSLITRSTGFYIHKIGFDALQKNVPQTPVHLKSLTNELSDYYLYKAEGTNFGFEREDRLVWKTLEDWESKYNWYASVQLDTGINEERLRYLVNSPEYKNKAATFLINTRNALDVMTKARLNGLNLFKKIRSLTSISNDSILFEIEDSVFIPDTLKINKCANHPSSTSTNDVIRGNSVLIIKNNTSQKIKIYAPGGNRKPNAADHIFEIESGDFTFEELVKNQWYEIKDESGSCLGSFRTKSKNAIVKIVNGL
ncbi:hypothetical protein BH09BAC3_BH09BAC3_38130 [soil metagenome]